MSAALLLLGSLLAGTALTHTTWPSDNTGLLPVPCCGLLLWQGLDGVQQTFDAVLVGADRARGKWHRLVLHAVEVRLHPATALCKACKQFPRLAARNAVSVCCQQGYAAQQAAVCAAWLVMYRVLHTAHCVCGAVHFVLCTVK